MKRISTLLFALCLSAICLSAKDIKTIKFYVPQMVCANCEAKIMKNIPFEKGVKDLKTDVETHTVVVTYDADKTSVEKLVQGFEKFGYKVSTECCKQDCKNVCQKQQCDKSNCLKSCEKK